MNQQGLAIRGKILLYCLVMEKHQDRTPEEARQLEGEIQALSKVYRRTRYIYQKSEMANGSPFKEKDSISAINFVDVQVESKTSDNLFIEEQKRLELSRTLHNAHDDDDDGKALELGKLLNQIGSVFKHEKVVQDDHHHPS